MRFQEIPDINNSLLPPSNDLLLMYMMMGFAVLIAVVMIMLINLLIESPGKQTMSIINQDVKLNRERSSEKAIEKKKKDDEKRKQAAEKFNIQAKRCEIMITYDDIASIAKERLNKAIIIGILLSAVVAAPLILFIKVEVSTAIMISFFINIITILKICFKEYINVTMKSGKLKDDYVEAIYYFVSMYKYSSREKALTNVITEYLDRAGVLKVDLMMLVSDLNAMTLIRAFDRLSERIPIQEIRELSSFMKSAETLTSEQLLTSVAILDRDMKDKMKEINKKKVNKNFKMILLVVAISLVSLMMMLSFDSIIALVAFEK